jgi:hypothetical protein
MENNSHWASGFDPLVGQQNNCAFLENKYNLWNATSCNVENDFICKIKKVSPEPQCYPGWTEAENKCYKVSIT